MPKHDWPIACAAAVAVFALSACDQGSQAPQQSGAGEAASQQTPNPPQDAPIYLVTDLEGRATTLTSADFYERVGSRKLFSHGVPVYQGSGVVTIRWERVARFARASDVYNAPFRLELTDGTAVEGEIAVIYLGGATELGDFEIPTMSLQSVEVVRQSPD